MKNKITISIIAFIVFSALIVGLLIIPVFQRLGRASQELQSQEGNLISLETQMEDLNEFKVIYQEITPFLENMDALFTDPDVPVDFITFLERKALESNLTTTISPSAYQKQKDDPWPSLNFQITSTGSFPEFMEFLEKLENSPYLLETQNLNVSQIAKSNDVKAVLSIKVFTK